MNQDYELKFYENADRCFEYLDEKYPGMWFVPHAKAAINYLWSNEDLVIEDVPIEHEIVQARMMERLNVDKLEEYLKEKEERSEEYFFRDRSCGTSRCTRISNLPSYFRK